MRFESGVNILLQADLINLQGDLNANLSPAEQSLKNVETIPASTIPAGTNAIIFIFEHGGQHPEIVASYKAGMELINVSGTNMFDTTQKTIITNVSPGAVGQIAIQFTPATTTALNPTDPVSEIRAAFPGEFITNTPIFLFGNKDKTDPNYDNYSPHTDPQSFDISNRSWLNGIDPTKQPRSFGLFTFERIPYQTLTSDGSIEYNIK